MIIFPKNKEAINFTGFNLKPYTKTLYESHHFASIAGAGPIVGPIIAVTFGWIPAVIWILVGGIFFGAVHDLSSMVASMRHDGKSIGVIIQKHIGQNGKRLLSPLPVGPSVVFIPW